MSMLLVFLILLVPLAIAWFLGYMLPRGVAIALAVVCGVVVVWTLTSAGVVVVRAFARAGSASGYGPAFYLITAVASGVFGLTVLITSAIAHRAQERAEREGYQQQP
jgi:hypothetical protein